ncbi:hypothetical protein BST83_06625 [Polaribacter filamentus]|uniref:DUF2867 domain-containing protein n=1 Tax=Polaribacter filamentus TaxID=53483 RepID=A0A2S7KW35_9FLAO|nr:DUF2867 domain-containing protein [Polaribacter filamentus]PQB06862.1 hypothetical protein BST83_06625 [Polaribacter filamentus]
MKILKTEFPENSILNTNHKEYDYSDSYKGVLIDKENKIHSTDIVKAFFASGPKWVGILFVLRNKIVTIFGLKTGNKINNRQQQLNNFKCEPNERLGLFKVFNKTENEVILGEDDKHLNFRISLLTENLNTQPIKKEVTISTTVKFNNWFGRLYFLPIRPFHKLIVPKMLKAIIKELNKKD